MGFEDKTKNKIDEIGGKVKEVVLGIILLLISNFAPLPAQLDQIVNVIGWILLVVGGSSCWFSAQRGGQWAADATGTDGDLAALFAEGH